MVIFPPAHVALSFLAGRARGCAVRVDIRPRRKIARGSVAAPVFKPQVGMRLSLEPHSGSFLLAIVFCFAYADYKQPVTGRV